MKFVINHPQRFHKHSWGLAFLTGMTKVSIVMMIEIMNILALLVKCTTIDVLTGYLRYYAIVNFDTFIFDGLNKAAPFYSEVFDNKMLVIDRTSSLKNNWSASTYNESLDKEDDAPLDRSSSSVDSATTDTSNIMIDINGRPSFPDAKRSIMKEKRKTFRAGKRATTEE